MKLFYSDLFVLPLPEGHRFPMSKYRLLRESLIASGEFTQADFLIPAPAHDDELARAHDRDYIQRVQRGELTDAEQRLIGFPWSPQMVERSRRSSGATIGACRMALRDGVSANLAGGTHHAGRAQGEGFSVFNDAAVAARAMQAEGLVKHVLVIDLDVHQGNGTAQITAGDDSIFTFSMHGAKNYPFRREFPSDLDVDLPDGTADADYLAALDSSLKQIEQCFRADIIIYLAGADPYEGDRLGRLKLTMAGLKARDERVFGFAKRLDLPVAIAMAGGYARNIEETVAVHAQTITCAKHSFTSLPS
jgi:acetoin utilization deacetylase AcuC-like enzyme